MNYDIKLRNILPKDITAISRIEREFSCDETDFNSLMLKKRNIGTVAEIQSVPVGYIIFSNHNDRFDILHLAVTKQMRRCRIGYKLISNLICNIRNRKSINAVVSEYDLETHLFFSTMGFKATEVFRNYFGLNNSGYHFSYDILNPYNSKNKIVSYPEFCENYNAK